MQDMQEVHSILVGSPAPGRSRLTPTAIGGIVAAGVLMLLAGALVAWRCSHSFPACFKGKCADQEVCICHLGCVLLLGLLNALLTVVCAVAHTSERPLRRPYHFV